MGGVSTWQDALEFIMAGAAVVQIGTANFIKPSISLDILEGMQTWLESQGIANIEEIRGSV
jgi:dihydroorotate dehydrogenase (NAD+) catalytic subunit